MKSCEPFENIDRFPEPHIFPIVGKLRSTIQADNIRFALVVAGCPHLASRKRGPSMLTAKNKVEEWPYHPNPQDKFTITSFRQKRLKALRFFCRWRPPPASVQVSLLAAASRESVLGISRSTKDGRILHALETTGPHP